MANLATDRKIETLSASHRLHGPFNAAAATKYYRGLIYTFDPANRRLKNPGTAGEIVVGYVNDLIDNSAGAADAKKVDVFEGIIALDADATNPPTQADEWKPAWATSNHEISRRRNSGSLAGLIVLVESTKVFVWVGPIATQLAQSLLMGVDATPRTGTASPIAVTLDDRFLVSNLAVAGAVAVTGPSAAPIGHSYTVHDGKGDAGANNITITPAAGETINGAATLVISANRGTKNLKKITATDWAAW